MIASSDPSPMRLFEDWLNEKAQTFTEMRRAIAANIFLHERAFDAETIENHFRRQKSAVTTPAIYRTLADLCECGLLRSFKAQGRTMYHPVWRLSAT